MENSLEATSDTFCSRPRWPTSPMPSVARSSVKPASTSGFSSVPSSRVSDFQWRSRMPGLRRACTRGTSFLNPSISCFRSSQLSTSLTSPRWLNILPALTIVLYAALTSFSTTSPFSSFQGPFIQRCRLLDHAPAVTQNMT